MVKNIIALCFILFSVVFAQKQPSNSQRFILYEINSIKDYIGSKDIFPEPNPVGENNNIILLDSYTGKTYILSSILQSINKDQELPVRLVYRWVPIYFDESEIFDSDGLDIRRGMSKIPSQ